MRVLHLLVAGFRGFPRPVEFDLDADAVIVSGVNGSGKTSMFDAILWALSGSVERLQADQGDLVSKYSSSGEARVEVVLDSGNGDRARVVRRFDGTSYLTVQLGDQAPLSGTSAEAALLDLIWPDARSASDPWEALSRSLTRATYLQQDAVREFVEADDEQERFQVVSELVGMGRVAELQRQLESSRTAWSKATNVVDRDLQPSRGQLAALRDRLARLGTLDATVARTEWSRWQVEAVPFLAAVDPTFAVEESSQSVDRAVGLLQRAEDTSSRRLNSLRQLSSVLARPAEPGPDLTPLQEDVASATALVRRLSEELAGAQAVAAAERRRQVEAREQAESLRSLAQLALRHLGETCPVCGQAHDAEHTRQRLEGLLGATGTAVVGESADLVAIAATALEDAQRTLSASEAAAREAQIQHEAYSSWAADRSRLAEAAQVPADLSQDALDALVADLSEQVERIRSLRMEGERISLQLVRAAEATQREAVESQIAELERQVAAREAEIASRSRTGELANEMLGALREASETIVAAELARIEPLLQRVYATVDPHPSFRAVRFLTRTVRGRGRLWTALDDPAAAISVEEPSVVLSSSQLNVLAVATFLAMNLAIDTLPLQLVCLDDPLQSLDTVNLLGLADLLRRVRTTRQVFVSTHDEHLSALLERKLRPVTGGQRTRSVKLRGWSTEGPSVSQAHISPDATPLRLVASA